MLIFLKPSIYDEKFVTFMRGDVAHSPTLELAEVKGKDYVLHGERAEFTGKFFWEEMSLNLEQETEHPNN